MAARIEQAVSKSKDLKCPPEVVQRDLKDLKDYCGPGGFWKKRWTQKKERRRGGWKVN